MRALAAILLLSLSLSGCVGGNGTGDTEDFQRTCPTWTAFSTTDGDGQSIRPAAHKSTMLHFWNNTSGPEGQGSWPDEHKESPAIKPGSPGGLRLNGEHPVDFYEITFERFYTDDVDTELRVQTDGGRQLLFRDMDTQRYTAVLRFPDGTDLNGTDDFPTYRVELSNPGADPAPAGLVLVWDHAPDKDGDARTHSYSVSKFDVHAWFRVC